MWGQRPKLVGWEFEIASCEETANEGDSCCSRGRLFLQQCSDHTLLVDLLVGLWGLHKNLFEKGPLQRIVHSVDPSFRTRYIIEPFGCILFECTQ